ncbi:hypothetical protein FQN54_003169 [Arachnomyces sp. PD_36]|nr:hypothetical protein FQN54_003169 [Arachnomyces sp. PD_36]
MFMWQASASRRQLTAATSHDWTKLREGVASTLQQFSTSSRAAQEDGPPARRAGRDPLSSQSNYRSAVNGDVRNFLDSSNRRSESPTGPRTPLTPASRGPIDARSLGINSGKPPGQILRSSKLRGGLRGGARGGPRLTGGQRLAGAPSRFRGRGRGAATQGNKRKPQRRKRGDEEEGLADDPKAEKEIEAYYAEQKEKERPRPIRYEPEEQTVDGLKATWPALPIGETAAIGTFTEKLARIGGRLANDYAPKEELAKRVFQKQRVLFSTEEEKVEVMEMVKKMEDERVGKLTERKGQVVKAEDVSFEALSAEERKDLVETLATGSYPKLESKPDAPAVVSNVLMNLRNNETYNGNESSQFMAKLETLLPKKGKAPPKRAAQ